MLRKAGGLSAFAIKCVAPGAGREADALPKGGDPILKKGYRSPVVPSQIQPCGFPAPASSPG